MYSLDCILAISNGVKWIQFADSIKKIINSYIIGQEIYIPGSNIFTIEGVDTSHIYRATLYDDSINISGPIGEIVSLSLDVRNVLSQDIEIYLFDKDNNYSTIVSKEASWNDIINYFPRLE